MQKRIGKYEFISLSKNGGDVILNLEIHPSGLGRLFGAKPFKKSYRHTGEEYKSVSMNVWYDAESGEQLHWVNPLNSALDSFLRSSEWNKK